MLDVIELIIGLLEIAATPYGFLFLAVTFLALTLYFVCF